MGIADFRFSIRDASIENRQSEIVNEKMTTYGKINNTDDLVQVKDLVKYFPIKGGLLQKTVAHVKAVDGVSFSVKQGETLGLVGESGCGKTTVGRTILRLTPSTSGSVIFEGQDVFKVNDSQLKTLRKDMQIIFQDPYSSLDPRMPVGESVGEGSTRMPVVRALAKGCWCTACATQRSAMML